MEELALFNTIYVPVVLTILACLILYLLSFLKGKRRPSPPSPPGKDTINLFVVLKNRRWVLSTDNQGNNTPGTIRVKQGQTLNYTIAGNGDYSLHLQFPQRNIFDNLRGVDDWVSRPAKSIDLVVSRNDENLCEQIYAIAVTPFDPNTVDSPYIQGGSPPKMIVEYE